ncbi:hypothetical protein RHGRI_030902 [Rhododendron griersonianum]|uniref:Uncharacterized protein n=1 Tax=Rhododendron griersonianum TaxID=479676 RepID=A0AAV6I5S0_9ERIC|nr:hypothetical protein RHGRI_030902 [Rhododendron griersonianum]
MPEHLRVMSAMIRDLRSAGNVLTDEQQILAMLRSLPDATWDHFKLTMTHNEMVKTFNDLKCHLELEAERQDAKRGNQALVVESGQRKTIGLCAHSFTAAWKIRSERQKGYLYKVS